MSRKKVNYLEQHRKFFGDAVPITVTGIEKGQVIKFNYKGEERHVFVVHGNWKGKMHGLNLKSVPRRPFLTVINAPDSLTEHQLYDQKIAEPIIKRLDAYRTYDRSVIANLRTIAYDSTLQEDERGEQHIDQHESMQELEKSMEKLRISAKRALGK